MTTAKPVQNSNMSEGWDMDAHFEKVAVSYEKSAGAFTRNISRHLVEISDPPFSPSSVVLDNACGPGITCTEILAQVPRDKWPGTIHATDFSPAMVREVQKRGHKEIQAQPMDAQDLKFPDDMFTHHYFAFAIFAVPDATKAAHEVYRTLKPGGVAYVTTWKGLGWTTLVDAAIKRVRPDAPKYLGPLPPEWFKAEKLKAVLISGGFEEANVDVHEFYASMGGETLEGMLEFMSSGVLAPATKGWSEEEVRQLMKGLEVDVRNMEKTGARVDMPAWIGVAKK